MTKGPLLVLLAATAGCVACDDGTPDCRGSGGEFTRIGGVDVDVAIFDVAGERRFFELEGDEGEIDVEDAPNTRRSLFVAVSEPRVIVLDLRGVDRAAASATVGPGAGFSITGDINGAAETGTFEILGDGFFSVHFEGDFAGAASVLDIDVDGDSDEGGCV